MQLDFECTGYVPTTCYTSSDRIQTRSGRYMQVQSLWSTLQSELCCTCRMKDRRFSWQVGLPRSAVNWRWIWGPAIGYNWHPLGFRCNCSSRHLHCHQRLRNAYTRVPACGAVSLLELRWSVWAPECASLPLTRPSSPQPRSTLAPLRSSPLPFQASCFLLPVDRLRYGSTFESHPAPSCPRSGCFLDWVHLRYLPPVQKSEVLPS